MPPGQGRRRYRRLLHDIDIPEPFELAAFCANLERSRSRKLVLHQLELDGNEGYCGLYVELPEADHVFYPASTTPSHQQHIVMHELAHLLCGHLGPQEADRALTDAILRELLPDLDPTLVRIALGRSGYSDPQEKEAETLASLILTRSAKEDGRQPSDGTSASIETAFG